MPRLHLARLFAALFGLFIWLAGPTAHAQIGNLTGQATFKSPQTTAELLVHAPEGVAPGKTIWAGLQLKHAPKWHTYWLNSGDSGLPTQLTWELPSGVTAGDIAWPTPKKFQLGPLANYGYDGTVLLATPLILPKDWQGKHLTLSLRASWLTCRTECIPEEATLQTSVPANAPPTVHGRLFEATADRQPTSIDTKSIRTSVEPGFLQISATNLPANWSGKSLEAFPHESGIVEPGAPWTQRWQNQTWTARLPLSALRTDAPGQMTWVLASNQSLQPGEQANAGVRFTSPVEGTWPAPTDPNTASHAGIPAGTTGGQTNNLIHASGEIGLQAWMLAVLGAFLGGVLLNLMPCVFPVLAIKVLAFTQHNDKSGLTAIALQAQHRASGLAYTAGVVLSFMALGGLLLGLRAAGEQLGWGFQLQSPVVVVALAILFTLIGLNLLGVFEVGNVLPSSVASLQARHPTTDAFLTGVLATAVASPCTAPFMGAALGLAIGLPVAQALAVFAAIGLGMALPYLLASGWPVIAHALPRPGPWMVVFKQLLAFPMFATVVWLVWVLGHQSGIHGAAALLAVLVTLALTAWAWGLSSTGATWLRGASTLALLGILLALGPQMWAADDLTTGSNSATGVLQGHKVADGRPQNDWAAWSPTAVAELNQQGQSVFVDFTAAWCVTCQYNKRNTLSDRTLMSDMASQNIVRLRADWTRRDPAITTALAALGRNGVPTYALYRPGRPPVVLSEILTVAEVRAAVSAP